MHRRREIRRGIQKGDMSTVAVVGGARRVGSRRWLSPTGFSFLLPAAGASVSGSPPNSRSSPSLAPFRRSVSRIRETRRLSPQPVFLRLFLEYIYYVKFQRSILYY